MAEEMTDEQLETYLSELEEQERERDRVEGVFDPLINIDWGSSEKTLASIFSNMAKETWPYPDEEPNYSMDQFRDPAMEMTTEPTANDSMIENSSAFQVSNDSFTFSLYIFFSRHFPCQIFRRSLKLSSKGTFKVDIVNTLVQSKLFSVNDRHSRHFPRQIFRRSLKL